MISRRPARLGTSTLMVLSKRPGRNSAGSRSAARLVAPITRKLAGLTALFCAGSVAGGSHRLTTSINALPTRRPNGRDVKRLQLYEQLVDNAGDALTARARAQTPPGGADGVYLLDEADGAPFSPRVVVQRPKIRPYLAVGLAVVHRLEGR